MACHEMGQYYDAMTSDMGSKLSGYYLSLQGRFGDPRVYAAQKEQMAAQEASVAHRSSQRTAELLKDAYASRQAKNREEHHDRMSKRQESRNSASPPESAPVPARRRTAPTPRPPPAGATEARPSAS